MELKNLRILVTGGAGFIGSHLVDQLAQDRDRSNEVIVFDDFSIGSMDNLRHHPGIEKGGGKVKVFRGDVRDPLALRRACDGVDVVFHLATNCVRLSLQDPKTNHDVNSTGTLNALMAAHESGVKRFIYCSSSEVYGNSSSTGTQMLAEDSPMRPTTVYGASKLTGELYALSFHQTLGLPGMVVRPFNAYGPRSHALGPYGEVIPRFAVMIKAGVPPVVFGDGRQTRDFTYVEDTAKGLVAAAECDALLGDTINLAHGEEVSVIHLVELLCELSGRNLAPRHVDDRPGDIRRLGCDVRKLKRILGVEAAVSIRDGLERYLRWLDATKPNYAEIAKRLTDRNWVEPPLSQA